MKEIKGSYSQDGKKEEKKQRESLMNRKHKNTITIQVRTS